jgi:hypothetical protein
METLPPDNRTYHEHSKTSRMNRNWLGCGLGHPAAPFAVSGRDTVATPPHRTSAGRLSLTLHLFLPTLAPTTAH